MTYDADGNVSPLTCADGGVNAIAWHSYAYFAGDNPLQDFERLGCQASA